MPDPQIWKISIDVGGTFTDALGIDPSGNQHALKVLSSGITKGQVTSHVAPELLTDDVRNECDGFWNGYQIRFLDRAGAGDPWMTIADFTASSHELSLDQSVSRDLNGCDYEIAAPFTAAILAIRKLLQLPMSESIPRISLRLGSTRGTNALLTRTGCPTALLITEGFGDLLEIGEQNRPFLFQLAVQKHRPLYRQVVEIEERILFDGAIEKCPDHEAVRKALESLLENGIESLAICFMHGYAFPDHEHQVAEIARKMGFREVRCSSDVAPLIKIVPRGETTVLDAYLNPILQQHLAELSQALTADSQLRLMTSAGGLVPAHRFSGRDSILSGPAGGVVGFAQVAGQLGFPRSIGFDMGGTSTDVARFDGNYEKQFETFKAGVRIVSPTLAIETVAAGGGSICTFDGIRLLVGPESAGADPGPSCYGCGGPLTVTDLNVYLGRLVRHQFPFPLDTSAVQSQLEALTNQVNEQYGRRYSELDLCNGLLTVANNNMASAIRTVSVAAGFDPRDYAMVAFGGAACQHACQIADLLDMQTIISHPLGGVLSAVGISKALATSQAVTPLTMDQTNLRETLREVFFDLQQSVADELQDEGFASQQIRFQYSADMRYRGTQSTINISGHTLDELKKAFVERHRDEFGYVMERPIEWMAARVIGEVLRETNEPAQRIDSFRQRKAEDVQEVMFGGDPVKTPVFCRSDLSPGDEVVGPALVYDQFSCTVVDPGWTARVVQEQSLILDKAHRRLPPDTADSRRPVPAALPAVPDPVQLEVFNNHFTSIARQMGEMLRRTAVSVNVKERLDYSCAIFTASGDLVVNAPHIPVHLGAMGETVKATIELNPDMSDGDVFVTNDPYRGGSHLPDITVITPFFDRDSHQRIFFVATRCHHAEIGGLAAGSMSPAATTLEQEGVLISNFRLVDRTGEHYQELVQLLSSARFPSRNPAENIADVTAQVAANWRGIRELTKLIESYGLPFVLTYMEFIQTAAEEKTRMALRQLPDRQATFQDQLDCGATIRVASQKQGDGLRIDFAGTDPVLPMNLNANRAIVTAAILYCLRCLIDEDIPLNQGILNPIDLQLPACFINPDPGPIQSQSPAVAGGNVETSQRIVDVLLGAWEMAAASQGTMNNVIIGNERFSYYETICGGIGATERSPGADAVHSHMTNTRLTDPEILETQFPLRLRQFRIRRDSGGQGRHEGGCGIVREIEFRDQLQVSLMTNRRNTRPYGLNGGQAGMPGKNTLIRPDGSALDLGYQCQIDVQRGDRLVIETPGGGGWGPPAGAA